MEPKPKEEVWEGLNSLLDEIGGPVNRDPVIEKGVKDSRLAFNSISNVDEVVQLLGELEAKIQEVIKERERLRRENRILMEETVRLRRLARSMLSGN